MKHQVISKEGRKLLFRFLLIGTIFFLQFSITSCRKGELIGREVQIGDNDILLVSSDDFHITAKTVEANRERTDERFSGMIGAYRDPIFGPSVISYYSQYQLQQEGFEFPQDAVVDSVFVSLKLTGGYRESELLAETRSLMHFQVYEIAQDIYLDSIYFSNHKVKTLPNLVGEFNGSIGVFDSVKVNGVAQPAQIRIRLNNSWAERIMSAGPTVFASNESFVKYFKGLAIIPIQTNQTNSNGAIFYFNPLSGFTGVTIHYHTPTDTTKFNLISNSLTANFTTFQHDYSTSAVGPFLNDTAQGSSQLFLQATIGTDIEIELKNIVSAFGSSPKVINFAELIIPVDATQPYYPLEQLSLSRKLPNGSAEFLPDQIETGNRVIDGSYNADSSYYRFRITQYIQEIIKTYTPGSNESQILRISPFGNNTLANRSVLYGPRPTDPSAPKMRIRITYTPLN